MQAGCIFQEAERAGEISDYKDNRIGWLLLSAKWMWVIVSLRQRVKVSVLPWLHIKNFFSPAAGEKRRLRCRVSHYAHVTALVRKEGTVRLEVTISGSMN